MIQMNFLAGHGLGLDDGAGLFIPQNAGDDIAGLGVGTRPVDPGSPGLEIAGQGQEMFIQVINGLPFDFRGRLPGGFPALEGVFAPVAGGFITAQGGTDELPMPQVAGFLSGADFEFGNESAHELFYHAAARMDTNKRHDPIRRSIRFTNRASNKAGLLDLGKIAFGYALALPKCWQRNLRKFVLFDFMPVEPTLFLLAWKRGMNATL
jgi:hypothetical protein